MDGIYEGLLLLPDADPNDIEIIDFENELVRSGNNFYENGTKLCFDPRKGNSLGGTYFEIDGQIYFTYDRLIEEADLDTFVVLYPEHISNLAKDKNHVYFRDQIVTEADTNTFEFLPDLLKILANGGYYYDCDISYYARDKNNAYFVCSVADDLKILKSANPKALKFKIVEKEGIAYDDKSEFSYGKRRKLT